MTYSTWLYIVLKPNKLFSCNLLIHLVSNVLQQGHDLFIFDKPYTSNTYLTL